MNTNVATLTENICAYEGEISKLQEQVLLLSRGNGPHSQSMGIDEESSEMTELRAENSKLKHRLSILSRAIKTEENKSSTTMHQVYSIQDILYDLFKRTISAAFPNLPDAPVIIALSGNNPAFGDYQLNSAMQIANLLKQQGMKISPRDIANKILEHVEASEFIERMEVAGAGFINIWLSKRFGNEMLNRMLRDGILPPPIEKKYNVVVDFSSPNIAKEMHVGHLRSTIIGDSICRLLEYLGHSVLRINHIGDWGTQFGMLIAHLQDEFPDYMLKVPPISDLQTFYKASKKRFDQDEIFKKRAYECVVKLQGFDENYMKAWQMICDVSRKEFQNIYDRLNINLIERGESFYQTRMNSIVSQLKSQGLLEEDEGRQIMWPTEDATTKTKRGIPMTIVKSDGGYTYDTSDMATIKQRISEEHADWLIYVTDMGQATHFELLFGCAKRAGVLKQNEVRVDHVGFGVVLGEDKKKLKTRSGDTVRLCDLLDEGVRRSMEKIREKNHERKLSEDEIARNSEAIAYGCIKYADLSHNRNAEYVFSFDKMLEDKGNTAVYLLYALTRIRSIVRNAKIETRTSNEKQEAEFVHSVNVSHEKEWKLGKVLLRFPDVVRKVVADLFVHHLCEYVYEVATTFTEFYDTCYCIERDTDGNIVKIHEGRLQLVELTALMIERCLQLLAITPVSKM